MKLGGIHSAKILLCSVDFAEIEESQRNGAWDQCAESLAEAARSLERDGVDFIVICTNTMHKTAPQIPSAINIPVLHTAGATAIELKKHSVTKVGLPGTRYTMNQTFYKAELEEAGIEVLIPSETDAETVNHVISRNSVLAFVRKIPGRYTSVSSLV